MISSPLLLGDEGGYQIQRSVRLRSSASAYLNRTPASATNRRTWTWSGWVKRGATTSGFSFFGQYTDGNNQSQAKIRDSGASNPDTVRFYDLAGGSFTTDVYWTPVYRDYSGWYHVMLVADTTQATNTNRIKLYINGVQVTSTISATWPTQNTDLRININSTHLIGQNGAGSEYADGYLTEVNFIDGQALTPSSFGETNALTGVWQPKAYSGTYGTNGFELNFSDNSAATAAAIGKDYSGNGNNWTPNNISITAGATYDSMLDVPTLTSATAANYSVANPLSTLFTVTAGNMDFTYTNSTSGVWYLKGTLAVSSDKYYWEVTPTNVGAGSNISIGIILSSNTQTNTTTTNLVTDGYVYHCDGNKYSGAGGTTGVAYGATYTNNDVIGVALDLTAGTLVFYKNNVSQGTAFTGLTSSYMQLICNHLGGISRTIAGSVNAGQRPFAYTPPTGFVALNTQNLPTPTISNGANYMAATTYTGNGTSLSVSNAVNGISFQPDLVWIKDRSVARNHDLMDSIRGAGNGLFSNLTNAEVASGYLSSFNSNGFTTGNDVSTNGSGETFVGWQWNAGGSTVTNTSGSISAQVRANPTAGFSIVTYTGNGLTNQSIGHGLGATPGMVIIKQRSGTANWLVHHQSQPTGYTVYLNLTNAQDSGTSQWGTSPQTSTLFYVGYTAGATGSNVSASTYVAYCFAAVAGYSAFGSYTGNGSADGPFVFTGFRPRFVMIKRTDAAENWQIYDTSRNTSNVVGEYLLPNSAIAGATITVLDILSNGFKIRVDSTNPGVNTSSGTYIFMAFAENPTKYSLAR